MGKGRSNHCIEKKYSKKDEAMSRKKKVERSSGIKPFLYVVEEWPEDKPTQLLKSIKGRNKMDNKMFILQGNETPEQLMIHLKNYNDKIYNNVPMTPLKKLAFLKSYY